MRYVTIADFGDYTVEQPLNNAYKIKERDRKRRQKKRKRQKAVLSKMLYSLLMLSILGTVALYILIV